MLGVWVDFGGSGSSDDLLKRGSCGASEFSSVSLENHFQLMGNTTKKKWRTSEETLGTLDLRRRNWWRMVGISMGNLSVLYSMKSVLETNHLSAKLIRWLYITLFARFP